MSLKCCNKLCQIIETVPLYDTEIRRHRALVIGRCKNPKCGCLKAEFIYWDVKKECFCYEKIPKEKIKEVIDKYKKAPYLVEYATPKKQGSLANMGWKYHKNGCIYNFNEMLIEKLNRELRIYSNGE